jgi:hypothetical protein
VFRKTLSHPILSQLPPQELGVAAEAPTRSSDPCVHLAGKNGVLFEARLLVGDTGTDRSTDTEEYLVKMVSHNSRCRIWRNLYAQRSIRTRGYVLTSD